MEFDLVREPSPIIILGAARSGTKFLRDVLAAATGVRAVPYDVNYIWRYGAEDEADDILDPAQLTEPRIEFIRRSLRRLAKAGPDDVLVEKSVSNTMRVPFVERVFPGARYVHLLRDGREVAESAMRQWQARPDRSAHWTKLKDMPLATSGYAFWFGKNLLKGLLAGRRGGGVWGPRFHEIERFARCQGLAATCAMQWLESVTRARRDLEALPDKERRVFEIRYSDLIVSEAPLRRLSADLGIGDGEAIVARYRDMVRPPEPARWRSLPEADVEAFNRIMAPTLASLGYNA
jgi:hypothetical protein